MIRVFLTFVLLVYLNFSAEGANKVKFIVLEEDQKFRNPTFNQQEKSIIAGEVSEETLKVLSDENPLALYYRSIIQLNKGAISNGVSNLELAARCGVIAAMISLGDLYSDNELVPRNLDLALKQLERAGASGSIVGELKTASLLLEIEGPSERVLAIYNKLAQKENKDALFNLGVISEVYFEDLNEAIKYYQLAADAGHLDAMFNLALMYSDPSLEKHSSSNGYKYLVMAAENGHPEAKYLLADGLIQSNKEDMIIEGIRVMSSAALDGFVPAQAFLGGYYSEQISSEEDYYIAEKWMKMAAENGDKVSKQNLLQLYIAFSEVIPSAKNQAVILKTELGQK